MLLPSHFQNLQFFCVDLFGGVFVLLIWLWRVSATGSCSQQGAGKNKTLMSARNKLWLLALRLLSDKQGSARTVYPLLQGQTFETKMNILFRAFTLCRLAISTCQWWDVCTVVSFSCCPWNLSSQILTQVSHRLNHLFNGSLHLLKKRKGFIILTSTAYFLVIY